MDFNKNTIRKQKFTKLVTKHIAGIVFIGLLFSAHTYFQEKDLSASFFMLGIFGVIGLVCFIYFWFKGVSNAEISLEYSFEASEHCQNKQYEEAIKGYNIAIAFCNEARYYNSRGQVFVQQEKYDQAIKDFEQAIELDSSVEEYHHNLAKIRGNEVPKIARDFYRDAINSFYPCEGKSENKEVILERLEKALKAGYNYWSLIETHFSNTKDHQQYQELIQRYQCAEK